MSHEATNWAMKQVGLKPSTWRVLMLLADRHNPDYGCFPSQIRLAADSELSRASINVHLNSLVNSGLIRRVRQYDPQSHRQKATRYILGFEDEQAQQPSPEPGHGDREKPCPDHAETGQTSGKPCPDSGQSRVQILDTNLVRLPCKTHLDVPSLDPLDFCDLVAPHCGPGLPSDQLSAITGFHFVSEWLDAGVDLEKDILPVIARKTTKARRLPIWSWDYFTKAIFEQFNKRLNADRVAASQCHDDTAGGGGSARRDQTGSSVAASKGKGGARAEPPPAPTRMQVLEHFAAMIKSGAHFPVSALTATRQRELLAAGLVTADDLAKHGIR